MASRSKVKQHGREVYRLTWYDKEGQRRAIRLSESRVERCKNVALSHHVARLDLDLPDDRQLHRL